MTAQISCTNLWFLGMAEADVRLVRRIAGPEYTCRLMDGVSPPALAATLEDARPEDGGDPLLVWIGAGAWRSLTVEHPDVLRRVSLAPVVLVLEPQADRDMLEMAVDACVQQVVRGPLCEAQVYDALGRARQGRNIYQDMTRMSREIIMNRELLDRKSGVCSFLFDFFAASSGASDMRELAAGCRQAMDTMLPAERFSVVWWNEGTAAARLADGRGENARASKRDTLWIGFLYRQAEFMRGHSEGAAAVGPDFGQILMLPLGACSAPAEAGARSGAGGFLALELREGGHSGRDAALALNAVRQHLELLLNARPAAFFANCPVLTASSRRRTSARAAKAGAELRPDTRIMEG